MLTAQWTRKLPLIQTTAPAELAARLIHTFLDDFPDIESEQYFVIDFCSGAGGEYIFKSFPRYGSVVMGLTMDPINLCYSMIGSKRRSRYKDT